MVFSIYLNDVALSIIILLSDSLAGDLLTSAWRRRGVVGHGGRACGRWRQRAASCFRLNGRSRAMKKVLSSEHAHCVALDIKEAAVRPARGTPCRCAACTGASPLLTRKFFFDMKCR